MKFKILDQYLAKIVLTSIGTMVLVLAGLQSFILFVGQLDAIGRGYFSGLRALFYILMMVPYQIYLFFPVANLLGGLIGLGLLASGSELVIMRAAGLSIWHIVRMLLKTVFPVILLVALLGEFFIPKLVSYAETQKAMAMSGGQVLSTKEGMWFRDKNQFIHVDLVASNTKLQNLLIYKFNQTGQLETELSAEQAIYQNNQWILKNVSQTEFYGTKIDAKKFKSLNWDLGIKPNLLKMTMIEPNEMSLPELHHYLTLQKENKTQTGLYAVAFWKRLIQPITVAVMLVLGVPFIFGPLRSSSMGLRFLAGASVGFGFHLLDKLFGPISLLYQMPPMMAALLPTLLFLSVGLYFLRRVY